MMIFTIKLDDHVIHLQGTIYLFVRSYDHFSLITFTHFRSDSRCSLSNVREQFNSISSYIDASNVYGADEATSRKLRLSKERVKKVWTLYFFDFPHLLCSRGLGGLVKKCGKFHTFFYPSLRHKHNKFLKTRKKINKHLTPGQEGMGNSVSTTGCSDQVFRHDHSADSPLLRQKNPPILLPEMRGQLFSQVLQLFTRFSCGNTIGSPMFWQ